MADYSGLAVIQNGHGAGQGGLIAGFVWQGGARQGRVNNLFFWRLRSAQNVAGNAGAAEGSHSPP
jgi:hypothetical protein